MSTTISMYNDSSYIRVQWAGSARDGRKEYMPKAGLVIQKTDSDNFMLRNGEHILYLSYALVSTTQPSGHEDVDALIGILVGWANAASSGDSSTGTGPTDTLSRLRTSNPYSLFDAKFRYDIKPDLFLVKKGLGTETAVFQSMDCCVDLTVPITDEAKVVYQTKRYITYETGKSLVALISAQFRTTAVVAGNVCKIGYFDDSADKSDSAGTCGSGVFVMLDATGVVSVVKRTADESGVQTDSAVAQTNWNMDVMNGTGISGLTLTKTGVNIWVFDMENNNGGRIRIGVVVGGSVHYVHQFEGAGSSSHPNLFSPSLPIRLEMENTAEIAATQKMKLFSCCVSSEGGYEPTVATFSAGTGPDVIKYLTSHSDCVPLMSMKIDTAKIRSSIMPKKVTIVNTNTGVAFFKIAMNGTTNDATYTAVNANSVAKVATDGTAYTDDSGSTIVSGYVGPNQIITLDVPKEMFLSSNLAGTASDILTVYARHVKGSSDLSASLEWEEYE